VRINFALVRVYFVVYLTLSFRSLNTGLDKNHFTVRCLVFMCRMDVPWQRSHWIIKAGV